MSYMWARAIRKASAYVGDYTICWIAMIFIFYQELYYILIASCNFDYRCYTGVVIYVSLLFFVGATLPNYYFFPLQNNMEWLKIVVI